MKIIAINQRDILIYANILSNLINYVYCIDDVSIEPRVSKTFLLKYIIVFRRLLVDCRNIQEKISHWLIGD